MSDPKQEPALSCINCGYMHKCSDSNSSEKPNSSDNQESELTKAIYEAMQVSYLSERHDAIKSLMAAHTTKQLNEQLDRLYKEVRDNGMPLSAIEKERERLK